MREIGGQTPRAGIPVLKMSKTKNTHPSTWKWALALDGVEFAFADTPKKLEQFQRVFGGEIRERRVMPPKKTRRRSRRTGGDE